MSAMRNVESGFTLLELLVVVAVIGILAAIALPQYAAYRTRAFNKVAQSDLRNAVISQEATFVDRSQYWDCMNSGCNNPALVGFRLSKEVSIACTPRESGSMYRCSARHAKGSTVYYYDSENAVFWESAAT